MFRNPILFATVPALVVGIIFEVFLGHRHDGMIIAMPAILAIVAITSICVWFVGRG